MHLRNLNKPVAFQFGDVVPIGSGRVLVECERISKDGTTESARTLF